MYALIFFSLYVLNEYFLFEIILNFDGRENWIRFGTFGENTWKGIKI